MVRQSGTSQPNRFGFETVPTDGRLALPVEEDSAGLRWHAQQRTEEVRVISVLEPFRYSFVHAFVKVFRWLQDCEKRGAKLLGQRVHVGRR